MWILGLKGLIAKEKDQKHFLLNFFPRKRLENA